MRRPTSEVLPGYRSLAIAVIASGLKAYATADHKMSSREKRDTEPREQERAFLLDHTSVWHQISEIEVDWLESVLARVDAGTLRYQRHRGNIFSGLPI